MFQKTETVWMDGKLVPWEQANVHVMTHSLHYGVGVFEGIRYYKTDKGSAVFRLKEHMERFLASCKIAAMEVPYGLNDLIAACMEVSKKNKLEEGYLRPLAFISEGPSVGLWAYDNPVRVAILTWGWGAYLGADGMKKGIKAVVSSFTRHHRNIGMINAKMTGQYFNSVLAKRNAKLTGFDEAILLDPEGYVAEGTGENLFIAKNGKVYTPPLGSILHGITRDTIMDLLRENGISVQERLITRDELYTCDEIFLTGTAAEVTPIREIDLRPVGSGTPGPIAIKMQEEYAKLVHGKNEKHQEWLTYL